MNAVSTIPAPVAAQISGPGSFFGSCQIASGNFEDILNAMSENIMPELPVTTCDSESSENSENLAEPVLLDFAFQDAGKNDVLIQLQQILGDDAGAEAFERIVNLLEKGTLSVQADTINWDKDTFEKLTVSLLERLDVAIKQMAKISGDVQDVQEYSNEDGLETEKFLNLITDLLKTGMITPQEYETALKNPEESSLPEFLGELKKETAKLVETLENIEPVEPEQIAEPSEPWPVEQAEQPVPMRAERPRRIEQEQPLPMRAEQPRQVEQPMPMRAEQPRQVEQPMPMRAEQPRQIEQPEQAKQLEQPEQVEELDEADVFRRIRQFLRPEQPVRVEQPRQVQVEQPKQVEPFLQVEQPRQVEPLLQAEQPKQVQPVQLVQPVQPVQTEQSEPLLEDLRIISMEMDMEVEIKSKDKTEFYELANNLIEKGLINEQDLKSIAKIPATAKETTTETATTATATATATAETVTETDNKVKESNPEKAEPAVIKNVLDKLWTKLESANKVEKETIFSKFREVVEAKNTSAERVDFKSAKVEPEVRAVWEGGDLKIETINPKTGEKLHSVPVANAHSMQERIHEFEVVRQVVSHAKFITTPTGEQRLTMQLKPEHLGQMNLRIILNNGEMQIHARVESVTAQTALESHIGLLREGLEKQGINLDRLEVSVEQKDKQDAFSLAEKQDQHERQGKGRHHRNKEMHLAVSIKPDANSDTGRRLGYNTMEYLA